jgi:DNA-binding transcriptional LysR family regulator
MNLRFVEAFVWVVKLGGITRAAERLNLTQSAVSSRVSGLEEELGTLLIDRRARGFRLTWAGERFLAYAGRFLDLQRQMKGELGSPEHQPYVLRIGAIETILHSWLVPMVNMLKREYPRIELEITVEMTPVLNDYLRRGTLDLAFTAAPASGTDVHARALKPMEMVLVGPAALASTPQFVADIVAHELMTFQRGSQPHVALGEALRRFGLEDKRVHCLSSISALVQLAESDFGLATLPRAATAQLMSRYRVAVLDSEVTLAPLPVYANYREAQDSLVLMQMLTRAIEFVAVQSEA